LKKFKVLLFYCFVVLLFVGISDFWFQWAIAPRTLKKDEKIFVIQRGESTSSIIRRLYKEGLIKSPLALNLLLYKEGLTNKIQAGDFKLSSNMNSLEIAKNLTHGTIDYWLTIIEGWRAEEIARKINSKFQISDSKFINEVKKYEGFLFPDTYLIPKNAADKTIIQVLRSNFDKKTNFLLSDMQKNNLSLKEVITLASIVERESKKEEDRPIVAGILIKRWRNNWPLQADATIQYAVANVRCQMLNVKCNWWAKVTKKDLKINSPYNTYLHLGLPPTPICNPSLSAIKAVVYSKQTNYWYYLSDQKGKIHFAQTLKEHGQNIRKYL